MMIERTLSRMQEVIILSANETYESYFERKTIDSIDIDIKKNFITFFLRSQQ